MQFNKSLLGIGLIAMSIGMVGCGENMDNSGNQGSQSRRNTGTQVRMNMRDNTNSMFTDGQYKTTNRGRVLGSDRGNILTTENTQKNTNGTGYGTQNVQYSTKGNGIKGNDMQGNGMLNTQNEIQGNNAYDLGRMQRIQQELEKLQGYNDITCIVNGNTAIIGCTQKNNTMTDAQTKNEITNIVKRCDPSISNCEVVSNKEGINRISKMAEDIRKGNIGTTISQDFRQMLDDIIR